MAKKPRRGGSPCADAYYARVEAADKALEQALQACNGDPGCEAEAVAIHAAEVEAAYNEYLKCSQGASKT